MQTRLKLIPETADHWIRLFSIFGLLFDPVLRWGVSGSFGFDTLLCDLLLALGTVLLCPWAEDATRQLLGLAAGVFAGGAVLACTWGLARPQLRILCYGLLVTVPLLCRFVRKVRTLMRDMEFLGGMVSGWEMTMTFLNMGLVVVCLSVVILTVCALAAPFPDAVLGVLVFLVVLLFLFMFVRSITRRPVLMGSISDEEFKRKMSLSPMPKTTSRQYRRLYKAMCLLLEEKKPFLNISYLAEDMARDLCTNRSYLSRMISHCTGLNFNKLLNRYRIYYSMELYRKDPRLKVVELSAMSGFGNKVSYGMAFKMFMNQTPGEWCDAYVASLSPSEQAAVLSTMPARGRKRTKRSSARGG